MQKEILSGAVLDLHQQQLDRSAIKRLLEREIVALNPDTVEAMELLHSISRGLASRYGEDRTQDVRECIGEVEESLCELENTLSGPSPEDAPSGRIARLMERT